MSTTHWVLQDVLFDDIETAKQVLTRRQEPFFEIKAPRDPLQDPWPDLLSDPVVSLVSLSVARRLRKSRSWIPGVWANPDVYRQSHWSAHYGRFMLNDEQVFLPWKDVKRRYSFWRQQGWTGIFVRPDSGQKPFTGQVLRFASWEEDIQGLEGTTTIEDTMLVAVSAPKSIDPWEWRFWCAQGEVFAQSAYSWEDIPEIPMPQTVACLAQTLAKEPWKAEPVQVFDIGIWQNKAALIEINAPSCSGCYQANLDDLMEGMHKAAQEEWQQYV